MHPLGRLALHAARCTLLILLAPCLPFIVAAYHLAGAEAYLRRRLAHPAQPQATP